MRRKRAIFIFKALLILVNFGNDDLAQLLLTVLVRQSLLADGVSDPLRGSTALANAAIRHGTSDSKVTNFDAAFVVNENVAGLQISMDDIGCVEIFSTAKKIVHGHYQVSLLELAGIAHADKLLEVGLEVLHDNKDVVAHLRLLSTLIYLLVRSVNKVHQFWAQYFTLFGALANLTHYLDLTGNFNAVILAVSEVFDQFYGNHLLCGSALTKFHQAEGAFPQKFD